MRNLVSLVAWHDSGWNGRVCRNPKENKYCESFGYIRKNRKYKFCINNADINLGNSNKKACSEAVMFCRGKVIDGGRIPGIFFTNSEEIKEEIKGQLNTVKGKYSIIYIRENPLSESRVIVGCVKIREIIETKKKKNRVGFNIDFDVENDVIFALPYQELLEYCKNKNKEIPNDLIFEVGEFERYFRGMSNFISDEVVVQILKKGLEIVEKFNKFREENPDFDKYLTDEDLAFRPHVMKKFDEFAENIKKVIAELEGSRYKYPGLPGVLYFLGMEDAYSRYIELWRNEGEKGEEKLYNALIESLENRKENLEFGIIEKVIGKFIAQKEEFREFLINYAVYYELSGYKLEKIKEQYEKGFINLEELIKNPYILVEDLKENDSFERIIFEELDSWEKRRLGDKFNPYNPYRIRALLVEILKRHLSSGNTTISTKDLKDSFEKMDKNIVKITFDEFLRIIGEYYDIISEKVEIAKKEVENNGNKEVIELFTLKEIREYEKIIEDTINHLLKSEAPNIYLNLLEIKEKLRKEKPEGVDEEEYEKSLNIQTEAVINLLKNRVGILTGFAGTGKTTVIKTIVELMKEKLRLEKIRILTPTGISAMVVREKLGKLAEVQTIHRYISKEFRDYFDFDYYILKLDKIPEKEIDALIIDESSMVDIETMGRLLGTIKLDNLKYLIFVGDINQLPPVGAGKPFYDIYKYLEKANPQSICKLEIVLSADSKKITELSKLFLDIDEEERLKILDEMFKNKETLGNSEIYRIKENIDGIEKEIITIEVIKDGNIKKLLENAIETILKENNAEDFFNFAVFNNKLQIITPTKTKGEFGSYMINLFTRQESKFIPGKYKNKMLWNWFFGNGCGKGKVADKVIQIKNNYNRELFNGMMGYVYKIDKNDKNKKIYYPTNRKFNKIYEYDYIVKFYYPPIEVPYYKNNIEKEMEHAYAITIHKGQGSRFENVILIIPKGLNKFVSKEMLYTAITRAKKRLYIIVEEDLKNFLDANISELARRKTNLFGNFNLSYLIPYPKDRQIITINGEKVRSWQECVLANLFHEVGIEYIYEPLSEYLKIGVLPDFKLNIKNRTILWEHYGMLENEGYRKRQVEEKEPLYKQNGFEIIKLSEIDENTKLGDKVLIISTSEDLKDNSQVLQKLKILQQIS